MLAIDTYLNDIKKISHRGSRHQANHVVPSIFKTEKKKSPTITTTTTTTTTMTTIGKEKPVRAETNQAVDFDATCAVYEDDEILASNITQFNVKNQFLLEDDDDDGDDDGTDVESVKCEAEQAGQKGVVEASEPEREAEKAVEGGEKSEPVELPVEELEEGQVPKPIVATTKTNLFRSTSISNCRLNALSADKFRLASKSTPYHHRDHRPVATIASAAAAPAECRKEQNLIQKAIGVYASKSLSPRGVTIKRAMSLSSFVGAGPNIFSSFGVGGGGGGGGGGASNIGRRRMISAAHRAPATPFSSWKRTVAMVAVVLLSFSLALGSRLYHQLQPSSSSSSDRDRGDDGSAFVKEPGTAPESFESLLSGLKAKYAGQSANFWANLQSSYRHSIVKARDPSIILVVSDRNTSELATNISYDVLHGVAALQHATAASKRSELVVSPLDDEFARLIAHGDVDQVKLHLDARLDGLFLAGRRVALVENIQLIPAAAMLIFYTYGDIDHAKHPGVMILMTLVLDEALTAAQRHEFAESAALLSGHVEAHLSSLWSSRIGDDQLKPLFTRIANNVVLVV